MDVTSMQRQCRKRIECDNNCKIYKTIGFILMGIVILSFFTKLNPLFRSIAMVGSVFAFFAVIMTKQRYNANNIIRAPVNKDIGILAMASGIYVFILILL